VETDYNKNQPATVRTASTSRQTKAAVKYPHFFVTKYAMQQQSPTTAAITHKAIIAKARGSLMP
jgi:hypothetical protein